MSLSVVMAAAAVALSMSVATAFMIVMSAVSLTMVAAVVTILMIMMMALSLRIEAQAACTQGSCCLIGAAAHSAIKPYACCSEGSSGTASYASAYERVNSHGLEHACKGPVSCAVGIHHLAGHYMTILYIIDLELAGMSKMLEYLSILICHRYPHDILSFFCAVALSQSFFVAVVISMAAASSVTESVFSSPDVQGPALGQHEGKLFACIFIHLLDRGPSYLHELRTLLLGESLQVHEPYGLILVNGHVYRFMPYNLSLGDKIL